MSNTSKKLASIALTASTLLWAMGAASLPLANAQSASSLQAQIAALLAQINQLQSQLGSSSGGSASSGSYSFNNNLTVGSRGADVTALQNLLISKGYLSAAATGYFGSLTKRAVAAWQAASGISPASGYFGPKSRAVVNAMSVGTPPSNGGGGSTTPPPVVVAPATGLSVSPAADNPISGAIIAGAGRIPVMGANFTAGNSGAVTISSINFHKVGVVSDSGIAGAYLTVNGKVIAQYNSINQGTINFSNVGLSVPAGQTVDVQLAIDAASSLNAGNTVSFSVNGSDITAWDPNNNAVTAVGSFPMVSNTFTVTTVTSPSLATLSVASSSIGTTVTAGTTGNLVSAWTFTGGNSKLWLKGVTFHVVGSANRGDIRNVMLKVNGAQVGATLPSLAADGTAYFNALAAPVTINTGSNNVQVFADVMGSPSYTFQFELLNGYDINAVDSQYNTSVIPSINGGADASGQITIQKGQITSTQDPSTPTGNIAKGQTQITLSKFDFYAAGEAVKVKFLGFSMTFAGVSTSTSAALSSIVKNVSLTDDAGGQVGSTINTPPSGSSCDAGSGSINGFTTNNTFAAQGTIATAAPVYVDCFGTSGSPINYIIPANTTRVLSLKGDIQSTASFSTVVASLVAESSNLQGLTSSQTNSSGAAQGASRALASSSLTTAQNNALGGQSLSKGTIAQRIGSYSLTASSAEGVTVSTVSIEANSANFQNLKVMVGGTQFGTTQGSLSSGSIYTFSGTPFTVPQGGTTNVDVYADVLSSAAGSANPATVLTGCSASGMTSFAAISCSNTSGQNLSIAGQSSITITADSSQAPVGQVVMGTTGNPLATFRFTETSNVENVKITSLNVVDLVNSTSTTKPAFSNLQLWNGSNSIGSAGPATTMVGNVIGYLYTFNFGSPIVVPQANSISLVLKGDAASYASSGATDNTTSTFEIATSTDSGNTTTALTVIALGNTSNATSSVTLTNAAGNAQTVLRSKLTFAATPLGATSGRGKISSDQLATLSFTANSSGPVAINSVTVTFSGSATSTTFLDGVKLLDENNNVLGTSNTTSSACTGGSNTCTKTFNLGSTTNGQVVSAGQTRNWTLVVDSTKTATASSQGYVNLVATIAANTDIKYTDALDGAATTAVSLPTSVLTPINLNSVVYAQGT